ncbi:unnamed protein product [Dovyalis caffra]|uniref:DUF7081 domain-containing protein n=1 Tax=Dovyalis caffra TaxID=77055 RepID=A0AAV1R2B9_9ROSI|nr:unnamed protein product [Dovyalis caffra]
MSDPLPSPSNKPHDHGPQTAFGLIFGPDYGTPVATSCQPNEQQFMENDMPHGSNGSMHLLDEKNFFSHQNEEFVDNDVHNESNGAGHLMDEHNFFGQQNEQIMESDAPNKSDGGRTPINVNNSLRLVMPGESGEGLPYAPIDWPNPGDNWKWRVGRRVNSSGYYQDRFIYVPKSLQGKKKHMFASKPALENYIRSQFPSADVNAFFASFAWKIPAKELSPAEVKAAPLPLENPPEDETLKVQEGKVENPRYGRRQRKQILPKLTGEAAEEKKQKTPRSSQRKRKQDVKQDTPASASTSKRKATRSSKRSVSHTAIGEIGIIEPEPEVNVIPEGFDNYLSSLEDILTQPLSETQISYTAATDTPPTESDMAKARTKLCSLLAMDFPSLVSSRNISKLTTLASKLRKDPTLSAEQLVKLKLIEEIPSFSEVFLESRQAIEQVNKCFGTLEANKEKVNSLRNEYNELKEKADQLQSQVDSSLLTVQEIDNQIFQLQTWRAELTHTIENNKAAKVEVASAQGMVANSIPTVVRDIQVANSQIPEWELRRTNAEKRESEILEKFAPLKGFSLAKARHICISQSYLKICTTSISIYLFPFPLQRIMAEGDQKEPINEQVVANMYTAMRSELNQIYSKITELEMDVSEHSLVINAIQPLDPSRRCYRMIGGVLVERTIKEVLPAVQRNKEGIEEVIVRLNEAAEKKKKEIADFEAKYKIRIRKSDNEVKDDTNTKEASSQGVLVGPAGSSE